MHSHISSSGLSKASITLGTRSSSGLSNALPLSFRSRFLTIPSLICPSLATNSSEVLSGRQSLFSKSLSFNRFHTKLELPVNYSLSKMGEFIITLNFGFGNYEMTAKIIDY